jgi:hypothetical protein
MSASAQTPALASMIPTSVHVVRSICEPPRDVKAVATIATMIPVATARPASGSGTSATDRTRCRSVRRGAR